MLASTRSLGAAAARRRTPCALPRVVASSAAKSTVAALPNRTLERDDSSYDDSLPTLSEGDLAWCEVYGVDHQQMLRDAQDESPIALNAPLVAGKPTTTTHHHNTTAAAQQDIWSVVFGTTHCN